MHIITLRYYVHVKYFLFGNVKRDLKMTDY